MMGGARRGWELGQRERNVVKDAVERVWQRQKTPGPVGLDQAQSDAVLRPAGVSLSGLCYPTPLGESAIPHLSPQVSRMPALRKQCACMLAHRATVEQEAPALKSHHACTNQTATQLNVARRNPPTLLQCRAQHGVMPRRRLSLAHS